MLCRSSGMHVALTGHRERRFSYFLSVLWCLKERLTVVENSNPFMYFLPWFFILEKVRLGAAIQHGSTENFEIKFFGCFYRNILALKLFWSRRFSLVPEKPHLDPKNIVFGMGWTWVARSTWDFSDAKHNGHKPWKSNVMCFWVWYPKKKH